MPVALEKLIGGASLRRYDEEGNPVYTPSEELLMRMRWFDWVDKRDLLDALGLDGCGITLFNRYSQALWRLVEAGRVERRKTVTCMRRGEIYEYRLAAKQPDLVEEPEPEYDENDDEVTPPATENAAYLRSRRARRRAMGICIYCPLPAGEFATCDACRKKAIESTAQWRRRKQEHERGQRGQKVDKGSRCSRCTREKVPGKSMCQSHLEWMRERRAAIYKKRKDEKVCIDCSAHSEKVRCDCCAEKHAQRQARSKAA